MGKGRIASLLVLAILVAVAACSTPAGRSPGQVIDDATITTKVKAKLYKDDVLKGFAVSVHTFKGTVTLLGAVDTAEQMQMAGTRAQSVDGVVAVNNLLQLKGP
ncbi:MAG: BON domain-containing protein [Thermodesulfobacteriota bacterium]|nr:BON domain-containing protein [Thermodesulfobacteriota bacterium]